MEENFRQKILFCNLAELKSSFEYKIERVLLETKLINYAFKKEDS